MIPASWRAGLAAAAALAVAAPLAGQTNAPVPPGQNAGPSRLPVTLNGGATVNSELYAVSGIPARRPGQTWQVSMSPELSLFGQFSMGLSVLLSSQGSDLRQNMSRLGLNPRYRWLTLHLGDFTRSYSSYTLQGTQLSGAGLDLDPGMLHLSAQGGTSQRTVAAGPAGTPGLAYRRSLYAASAALGREGGSLFGITLLKAKDDLSSLAVAQADTTLLDTIPVALRPRIETRPQENLVLGTRGQLRAFRGHFALKGEAAAALITRDLESPDANPQAVGGGSTLNTLMPLQLSTSGDYSWHLQSDANLGAATLHGGYEYVGPGYTSLGLAYLINDRRAYEMGGTLRSLANHLVLQGQYQHQNDNLLHQKSATMNRDAVVGSAMLLAGRSVSTTVTVMNNVIANDASVDTFALDNHTFALTAATSVQSKLLGNATTWSVSYALQRVSDANVITRIPQVTVHNLAGSVQVQLSRAVSLTPTASLAVTQNAEAGTQRNVYVGFRGQARAGALRSSASVTQTFSGGRHVFGLLARMDYPLWWDARLTLQARHTRYGAIGAQPAFQESFATMSLARSF
jgi:hypothetical protein